VVVASKHLTHSNIVPILGATTDPTLGVATDPLELISEWMPGGNLTTYIANHADADQLSLVSSLSNTMLRCTDSLATVPVV
jgi:hypothetical protein